ncbi:outer membrane beta-barrel protein [Asticcacaulis machinosus]|uniref:Outer membrane beta-barrel protein n=1 Tax=Asticcacaulis machinosus TaxID=2984211 RepID=A0ABT5HJQ0_9CAUL|nr:outer membrane beta-barrel protein [Asticcacaulis machinosus]MDC7676458.1 outer membrane beta-barrel protein [Asticcacaulis machinosus]
MQTKKILTLTLIPALCATAGIAGAQDYFVQEKDKNSSVASRVPPGYEPLGIRTGGFDIYPKVDLGLERTDNVFFSDTAKEDDMILTARPEVRAQSRWSRHALLGSVYTNIRRYGDNDTQNTEDWGANVYGRADVTRFSNIYGGINLGRTSESRGDPSLSENIVEPVEVKSDGFNLGGQMTFNRFRLGVDGSVSALDYTDVRTTDLVNFPSGIQDQDNRDVKYNRFAIRGDYALSPDTSVFISYDYNERKYDQALAAADRNSNGYNISIGAAFDLTDLLRGEVRAGYLMQDYDNFAYSTARGTSFSAQVEWFPTRLTTVNFNAGRSINETPYAGASGFLSTQLSVTVDHELLRNFVISGGVFHFDDEYRGLDRADKRDSLSLGGRYLINRRLSLKGEYMHSKLGSDGLAAFRDYTHNSVKFTLGVQY